MNLPGVIAFWESYQIPISILLIILGSWLLARLSHFLLRRYLERVYENDPSSATAVSFLKNAVSLFFLIVATIAVIYTIPALRTLAETLTIGAGVVAAIAAFASQAAFANLVGGLFIVIFRPFRVGDRIAIGQNYEGVVEDITLRHTVIRDWEKKSIIIPNSVISTETIVNSDLQGSLICRFVEIPISYLSDLNLAIEIITACAKDHPAYHDVRSPEEVKEGIPPVNIRAIRYSDNGVILRVYLWGDLAETFTMASDLRVIWHQRLVEKGIKIGVPHRQHIGGLESGIAAPGA